jgi:hypothetical protein
LNEDHLPVTSWYVVNAIPIKYEITGMNADQSQVLIESITLRYEYYKILNLSAGITAAVSTIASLIDNAVTSNTITVP